MVFVTDMVKDADGMVDICEVSYPDNDVQDVETLFRVWNSCKYWTWADGEYHDAQVIKMVGEDELGYYLDRKSINREYISSLFEEKWGQYFNPALLTMTWRKVPSYTVTIMGWEVPLNFDTGLTRKRTRLLDYAQMALAIEVVNEPDISYYEDLLDELASDGELPNLEDVEGPEAWEGYCYALDEWVNAHLKVKVN